MVIRALIIGGFAFVGARFGVALAEESGYNCLLGHTPKQMASVYRVLPWGRTEQNLHYLHVALYPATTLAGGSVARGWYGPASGQGLLGGVGLALFMLFVSFFIQFSMTSTFINRDACGLEYYSSPNLLVLLWPIAAVAAVVALALGYASFLAGVRE